MSQSNEDKMRPEVDFSNGVRGKYLARYQRWEGITTATGPVEVAPLSTRRDSDAKIVLDVSYRGFQIPPRAPRTIAPEVLTSAAR